jgi:hypothetical protein
MLKQEERKLLEDAAVLITNMVSVKIEESPWASKDQEESKIQLEAIANMRKEFYSTLREYNKLANEKS